MYSSGELRTCKEFGSQHTSNTHCADIKTVTVVLCTSLLVPGTAAAVRRRRHRYGLKPRPAAKLTVPNR